MIQLTWLRPRMFQAARTNCLPRRNINNKYRHSKPCTTTLSLNQARHLPTTRLRWLANVQFLERHAVRSANKRTKITSAAKPNPKLPALQCSDKILRANNKLIKASLMQWKTWESPKTQSSGKHRSQQKTHRLWTTKTSQARAPISRDTCMTQRLNKNESRRNWNEKKCERNWHML